MKLTSENIESVILACLFKNGEDTSKAVIGEGCMTRMGFHPERIKAHEEEIFSMLKCLPDEFMQSKGGGMTFLNACNDNEGNQWADLHETIDKLLVLGLASGKAKILMPREMWDMLPGGVPYFVVNDKQPETV